MILDVDIGNSRIKWRLTALGGHVESGTASHSPDSWSVIAPKGSAVKRVRVSNVAGPVLAGALSTWTQSRFGLEAEFAVARAQVGGVTCGYRLPATLGVDRWLAVLASWRKIEGACVVVDVGSAITVDILSDAGRHLGGYIVPGLRMMQRALYAGTSAVKVDECVVARMSPGTDTREAVLHGCMAMAIALIQQTRREQRAPVVILTGGDAAILAKLIDGNVVVDADLVLDGLGLALP
ncbi:MAG: type III pantothenate kinase [Porticoccaceae bacterium]